MEDEELRLSLRALCVTRNILKFPPMKKLLRLLDAMLADKSVEKRVDAFGAYASSLAAYDLDPAKAFLSFLEGDVNAYSRKLLAGEEPSREVRDMMAKELEILEAAAAISPGAMRDYLNYDVYHAYFPVWKSEGKIKDAYHAFLQTAGTEGFGVFRDQHMFVLRGDEITPVAEPDPIRWESLQGYAYQRNLVWKNTRLLADKVPASNILLYGDSGSGKSSTIKAVANAQWKNGIRLIEVRKRQLHRIPDLLENLSWYGLSFILFIDDLSFAKEDDDFVALKGILEGSILARASNVAVYATSNRRRLIKETFSERGNDDVHANETVQQMTSLSDRFGLTIPFMDPGKKEYLQIVAAIAAERGVDVPQEELFNGAERFALEKGGRSGRAARQYVDQLELSALSD